MDIGSDSEDENTNRTLKQNQLISQDQEVLVISSESDCDSHRSYHEEGPIEHKSRTTVLPRYGEKTEASSITPQCQDCGLPLLAQQAEVFFCHPCLRRQLLSDESDSNDNPLEDNVESVDNSLKSVLNNGVDVEYLGFSVGDKESNNREDISEKNCVSKDGQPKLFWEFSHKDKAFWVSCPVQKCGVKNTTMKVNNVERHIRKVHNNIEPEPELSLVNIGCKGCGAASVSPAEVAQHVVCNWHGPLPEVEEYMKKGKQKKKQTTRKEKRNYQKEKLTDSQLAIHSMKTRTGKYWVLIPNSVYFLNCPKCPETLSLADVHNHMDTVHQSKEERFCCKCNMEVAVVDVRDHFKYHITGGKVQEVGNFLPNTYEYNIY